MSAVPSGILGELGSGAYVDYGTSPTDVSPPTGVDVYYYAGGGKWGIQWVNASASYYTQISENGDETVDHEVAPGVTQKDIGYLPVTSFKIRHRYGHQYSDWVGAA